MPLFGSDRVVPRFYFTRPHSRILFIFFIFHTIGRDVPSRKFNCWTLAGAIVTHRFTAGQERVGYDV